MYNACTYVPRLVRLVKCRSQCCALALYSTLLKGGVVFWTHLWMQSLCQKWMETCPQCMYMYHAIHLETTACGFEFMQVIEFAQVQYGPATRSQWLWHCKIGREFVAGRESKLRTLGRLTLSVNENNKSYEKKEKHCCYQQKFGKRMM